MSAFRYVVGTAMGAAVHFGAKEMGVDESTRSLLTILATSLGIQLGAAQERKSAIGKHTEKLLAEREVAADQQQRV